MSSLWQGAVWLLVIGSAFGVLLGFGGQWSPVLDAIGFFRVHFAVLAALGGVLALGLPRHRVKWIGFGAAALAIAMLGPVWHGVERSVSPGVKTRAVTIMTANVLGGSNPSLDLTASVLLAADADVLAVVEAPRAWSQAASLLSRHYSHSSIRAGTRNGAMIWSKFPLRRIETESADRNTPAFATATVDLGSGAGLGVTAVHLSWPLVAQGAQDKQIAVIGSLMPAEAGPKLMMGDFNAPPWSQAMKRVERNTDLTIIGGLRRTWLGGYPNPIRFFMTGSLYGSEIPSVLGHQIDHLLLSPGVGVKAVEVIVLPGSDHRAVWARLDVPLRVAGNLYARVQ